MSTETPGAIGANPEERLKAAPSLVRPLGLPVWFLLGPTLLLALLDRTPRLPLLSARVEALESNAVKVDQKVGVLDRKVDDMSANMTSQFQDVLSAIAALSKSQNGDDPKRKKQEGSPTS